MCRPMPGTHFNIDKARETCQQITQGMDEYTEGFNAGIDLISSLQGEVGTERLCSAFWRPEANHSVELNYVMLALLAAILIMAILLQPEFSPLLVVL